jgi:hypothetical protein
VEGKKIECQTKNSKKKKKKKKNKENDIKRSHPTSSPL